MDNQNISNRFNSSLLTILIIVVVAVILSSIFLFSFINIEYEKDDDDIISNNEKYLVVNLRNANLTIKSGDKFTAISENSNVEITLEENKVIVNNVDSVLKKYLKSNVTIYVPDDMLINNVSIDVGMGNIDIDNLYAEDLNMNFMIGSLNIFASSFLNKTNIFREIGSNEFSEISTQNLIFNQRIGNTEYAGKLTGNINIKTSIGEVDMILDGKKSDYKIICDKISGGTFISDESFGNEFSTGDGKYILNIDSGIGNYNINFID